MGPRVAEEEGSGFPQEEIGMASTRGQANQSLYLARLLMTGWDGALREEAVSAAALTQAYLPGVREHLIDAYGWFLLEVSRPSAAPAKPPRCCADLPQVAEGKSIAPEVRECQQLELGGWLGELLGEQSLGIAERSPGNLAAPISIDGPAQAGQWADSLHKLFDRMADSLDEY